jgi:cobalamin biosynthesis protein CbiD
MDDKTRRQQRFKAKISANSLAHYEAKYGVKGSEIQKMLQRPSDAKHVQSAQDAELEDLFESIIEEIEERQEFIEKMGADCDKATQARIKNEITSRIAELQRIRELQSK